MKSQILKFAGAITRNFSEAVTQILEVNGNFVPTADTCNMKVSGEVRPILLKNSIFFEVAGIRLDRPAEGTILGVSVGISQNSDASGLDGVANLFLNIVE